MDVSRFSLLILSLCTGMVSMEMSSRRVKNTVGWVLNVMIMLEQRCFWITGFVLNSLWIFSQGLQLN